MKQNKQKPVIIAALALLMAFSASTPAQAICRSFSGESFFKGKLKLGQLSFLHRKATYRSQQKARYYFQSRKPSWRSAKNRRVRKVNTARSVRFIATATYCMPGKINVRQVPKYRLPTGVYRKKYRQQYPSWKKHKIPQRGTNVELNPQPEPPSKNPGN